MRDENPNQELENVTASNEADVGKIVSSLENMIVETEANKENEERHQKTPATKKWYEGVVVKPVAFRSLTKRGFSEN